MGQRRAAQPALLRPTRPGLLLALLLLPGLLLGPVLGWQLKLHPDRAHWYQQTGAKLAVLCAVEGAPEDDADPPGLFWHKAPGSISGTGHVQLQRIDRFALSLLLPNTSVEDGGVYTCTGSLRGERRHARVELNFFGRPAPSGVDGEPFRRAEAAGRPAGLRGPDRGKVPVPVLPRGGGRAAQPGHHVGEGHHRTHRT